jgi:hypothetical protein
MDKFIQAGTNRSDGEAPMQRLVPIEYKNKIVKYLLDFFGRLGAYCLPQKLLGLLRVVPRQLATSIAIEP